MKIIVGSKNPQKIDAVREILKEYPLLENAEVMGLEASSGVSEQPKSLNETIEGSINRARASFQDCDYSIGLESGLMKVPNTKTGFMDVTSCAIFDGKTMHLGLSSAFEYPIEVIKLVFNEGLDINKAFNKTKLTTNPELGSFEGAVGMLTKGRLKRKEYTQQALRTALIHLENPDLY